MNDNMIQPILANVLIVDDVAENLQVLAAMLKGQGCTVRPAPSGKLALAAAESQIPDLILLDINMPEMDGYEVCRRLKEQPRLKDVPVIFISALNEVWDKVKAFQVGGVDYVTKPFQFEEVWARVRVHLELRRSKLEIQTLLSKTFVASLRTMTDILAIVNPVIFAQSNRLKRYARKLAEELKLSHTAAWHIEMAAMLSQLGCVTVGEAVLRKKLSGETLSSDELRMFSSHPSIGADLLGSIPRMETVAQIIRHQQQPLGGDITLDENLTALGSQVLQLLIEYDYLLMSGKNNVAALLQSKDLDGNEAKPLYRALRAIVEREGEKHTRSVPVRDLSSGMILLEDVQTESGLLLLHRANELTPNLLKLLRGFSANYKIKEPVQVLDVL